MLKKMKQLFLFGISFWLLVGCQANNQTTGSSVEMQSEKTHIENTSSSTKEVPDKLLEKDKETTNSGSNKVVALTFDDGPDPFNTPQLLALLKKEKIQATFFLVGQKVQKYPEIIKNIAEQGHEIGNHTWDHKDLTTISGEALSAEITKTDESIKHVLGEYPKYVRPPYGSVNVLAATIINRPIIEWSVDSEDWRSRNADAIVDRIKTTVYDGSIILLHDIHPETIQAMPRVIDLLKKQGYAFQTISELLGNPTTNENYYGKNDYRAIGKS